MTAAWVFETERFRIRPLFEDDEPLYVGLYCDPDTMRFIGPALTCARAAASFHRVLASNRSGSHGAVLTLVEKATGSAIGLGSIQNVDLSSGAAEAGIMLRADARARGYSREGLAGIVKHAFDVLPLKEVRVQISADYAVVRRLVVSVGFTPSTLAGQSGGMEVWCIRRLSVQQP